MFCLGTSKLEVIADGPDSQLTPLLVGNKKNVYPHQSPMIQVELSTIIQFPDTYKCVIAQ